MKSDKLPIAFFDSGVGLYSILLETKKLLPKENYIVFADQAHNPYGEKSQYQIRQFAEQATRFLIKKHRIKMMVLACNTASVLALSHLRNRFTIPIVGVVPAIKTALERTQNNKVTVMSTPATAKSKYLSGLITRNNTKRAQVQRIACQGLEEAIEILNYEKIDKLLKRFTRKIKKFRSDVVVLGCTHYPLIKNRIKKYLGPKIKIVDSGEAVAKRIKEVLIKNNSQAAKKGKAIYYTSLNPQSFSKVSSILLKRRIKALNPNIT